MRFVPAALHAVLPLAGAAVAAAQILPAASWLPPVRALTPRLAGRGRADHVALTFDDGPDPASTPRFLDALEDLGVAATFFCVGEMAQRNPELVRETSARGHEVAVHGWYHRNQLFRPAGVPGQIGRAAQLLGDLTGAPPTWYRPPYGVVTGQALLAAGRARLHPVLWTVWAKDWTADTTPGTVESRVRPGLVGGATVLLHDTDAYAAPGCWRATLGALAPIVRTCQARGLHVGPLGEHGVAPARAVSVDDDRGP